MRGHHWERAALMVALGWCGATVTDAAQIVGQVPVQVEREGDVFHRAVCGHFAPAGRALCHAHVVTDQGGNILVTRGVLPNSTSRPAGYSPAALRAAYKVTGFGSSATTIAIVDAYGYPNAESDLATYRAQYGLPPCTTANGCFRKVDQAGGTTYPDVDFDWEQETALDLDMVSAMCRNCKILLVEATNSYLSNLAAAVNTAAALGAHAISNSYGGSEQYTGAYESAYKHPGVAVTASSGDDGYGVQFPASSPHVIAVGGTSLRRSTDTRGWTEAVWAGAGSGCSSVYAKPSWQKDPLCLKRSVADVSAVADPRTGVAVYGPSGSTTSAWMVFGGTSVAAPLIAGIYGVNGGSVNYSWNLYVKQSGLFDVITGSNGYCGGTYFCTGQVGYDGPSGLGTPNGSDSF